MSTEDRIASLITKYIQNNLTEAERAELDDWRATNQKLFERLTSPGYLGDKLESYSHIDVDAGWKKLADRKFPATPLRRRIVFPKPTSKCIGWAAVLLLCMGAGIYCWLDYHSANKKVAAVISTTDQEQSDIHPGLNKATITLNDGSVVRVDEHPIGKVAGGETFIAMKEKIGLVAYTSRLFTDHADPNETNTVSTPAGGNFQVKLPDGSNVWLDAGSSVTFNPSFTASVRKVQITGQAYFEVEHQDNIPFHVSIASSKGVVLGEIQVLGTHFSVNAYDDEPSVKTTLLKGSVQIKPVAPGSEWAQLKPGQQAQLGGKKVSITEDVNLEEVIAWKNGNFLFDNLTLKQAMRQIARWYNAEVIYETNTSKNIVGYIPKDVPVSQVLKVLELTGEVHFRVEGNRITVTD